MTRNQWPRDWAVRPDYQQLRRHLNNQHPNDPGRVQRIMDGMDAETNQDIAIWRTLGRR